jgi:pyrroline-5-carboxylate reductase
MTDSLQSPLAKTHITFIGGGNMGRALIGGLLASGLHAKQIMVVEPFTATAEKLKADFSVAIINSIDQLQFDNHQFRFTPTPPRHCLFLPFFHSS